jgi:hypothetical protein
MENNKKVGNEDVGENTEGTNKLPKGLQEKTKVNDR